MLMKEILFAFSIVNVLLFVGLLYLYFRDRKNVDFLFADLFVLCGAVFFFGQFHLQGNQAQSWNVFWNKFQYIGIFGLLFSFPLFTSSITKTHFHRNMKLSLGMSTLIILSLVAFTNLIITNQSTASFGFFEPDKGILYPLFIAILAITCIYFSIHIVTRLKKLPITTARYSPLIAGIFIGMICGIMDLIGLIINKHVLLFFAAPCMVFGIFIITILFAWTFLSQYSIISSTLIDSQKELEKLVAKSKKDYGEFINLIARTIDAKDHYTAGHALRVMKYSTEIANALDLRESEIELLRQAALLHDIGKISIPDGVLNKKSPLTREERKHIHKHPAVARQLLSTVSDFQDILDIVYHHHERIDGKGYPDGMEKNEIPLLSRILAVADTYDAMRSKRPYREPKRKHEAIDELTRIKGTQLDERIVEKFIELIVSEQHV